MVKANTMSPQQLEAMESIAAKMASGEKEEISTAWGEFFQATQEAMKDSFMTANGDKQVLAARGFRTLTTEETQFYEKLIEVGKSSDPKQVAQSMSSDLDIMPETIITDVYRELTEEHPLLNAINFQNVRYLTKWILNDHTIQTAKWGAINSAITEQITSAFKIVEVAQCKLSAFALIEKDMLDLGPVFLDNYIRTFLKEALLVGMEEGIITGTGKGMPIGLDRDVSATASVVDGVYPKKTAVAVTSFTPKEYGTLVAKMAKSEKGRKRKFDKVMLICNMKDYLEKVMPATTVLTANGTYAKDLFPFPTDTCISNELDDGDAILCIPKEYFLGVGTSKNGTITFDDSIKFFEDQRAFKAKMHGMGKAYDNTVSVLLDISGLEPAYIMVLDKTPVVEEETDDVDPVDEA